MSEPFPAIGDVFEHRYSIDSIIGTGGFAKVYGATQTELGRSVAIKILSRGVLDSGDSTRDHNRAESAIRRFRREARLVSQLRDPNTITIYDYGQTEQGLLYIVFERIEGQSLKEIIYGDGPMTPAQTAMVLDGVLSSLEEAHAMGILHRDVKPANIMLYQHLGRDAVKLLDFGIAKLGNSHRDLSSSSELTREGSLIGTPRYMSPEQIRDKAVTPASDLFGLGLVAYEMLVGEMANPGATPVTIIGRHLDDRPFVLPWSDSIPVGLRTVVHRLLEKDVELRFRTAAQAREALRGWDEDEVDTTIDVTFHEIKVEKQPAEIFEEPEMPVLDQPHRGLALVFLMIAALCVATIVMLANDTDEVVKPAPVMAPIHVSVEADAVPPRQETATKEQAATVEAHTEEALSAKPTPKVKKKKKKKKKKTPKAEPVGDAAADKLIETAKPVVDAAADKPVEAAEPVEPADVETEGEVKEPTKPTFFSLDEAL